MKLLLKWISLSLVLIIIASITYLNLIPSKYTHRQVKAIATATDNYLLDIQGHISRSPRPIEDFNFPIPLAAVGPIKTLYSGKSQYPFYCMTLDSGLGQPLVDNQQGLGVPVYDVIESRNNIIGYSKDCSVASRLLYYYSQDGSRWLKADEAYIASLSAAEQKSHHWLRIEQGTINRYIYTLTMPITFDEIGDRQAQSQWNKRLIYQFHGGSGIGHRQGRLRASRVMKRLSKQLMKGYAVISSSGNKTSYHYNMLLAEDTARRVKKQFTSLYGEPLYTVGVGGSGGGLAQYLIAQNSSNILDGLLPLYSYPDMVTQTTYALDCDLLNNYFTFRSDNIGRWQNWHDRQWIEGMNTSQDMQQRFKFMQPINQLMAGVFPYIPSGNSECIQGYFGLASYINNPRQGFIKDFFHPSLIKKVSWSYWQDMIELYGVDEHNMAKTTWDNEGVQYGLQALKAGQLSAHEFLDINRKIGAWKSQHQMQPERIFTALGKKLPLWLSLWGRHNITEVDENTDIAPRRKGAIEAMQTAYRSGQVFIGRISLPVLDIRHYLEKKLDMHHTSASFYTRLRLLAANGHHDNQIIWIADKDYYPVDAGFEAMDRWLTTLKENPDISVNDAKPKNLQDSCFDETGQIIATGNTVWHGAWNNKSHGLCSKVYPIFSNSRIQAGGGWAGDLFKCQLMPVQSAFDKGLYGKNLSKKHLSELSQIFPLGVCDYSQADIGRPKDL
ncbi:MAG: hypothetical protein HRU20_10995 [Pseudomonadales bacterium]|nr:hypothetical protein [Pseudomonadales bacterium]